jgi:hypothetical protein
MNNSEVIAMLEAEWRDRLDAAVLAEREACAKVADQISDKYSLGYYGSEVDAIDEVADAIRARGDHDAA